MRTSLSLLCVALAVGLSACNRFTDQMAHETLTTLDPLRAVFNADSGKVRAIFLASPT